MKSFDMERWVRQVSKTEAEEISCSECLDLISEYVETELAGKTQTGQLTRVSQHLEQCRVCREEYEVLHELADLENQGRLPSIETLKKSFE